jgi:hypothetical protein
MVNKTDENKLNPSIPATGAQTGFYEIRVKGQLDESWSDWLEGLGVNLLENGEMILSGYIEDQAALMGTLNKIYGLNLTLLSVSKVTQKE